MKMLIRKLKKTVSRQKLKKIILKSTPVSSKMHHLLQNYSLCYKNYVHRTDCFFTKYFRFRPQSIYACSNAGNDFDQDQYNVSKKKLLTSGHVELNPGPLTYKKTNLCSASPLSIVEARLHQFGLVVLEIVFLEQFHISYMGIQTVRERFVLLGYSS